MSRVDRLQRRLATYRELGQWDAVAAALRELLEHEPDNIPLWIELSSLKSRMGDYRAAGEAIEHAVPLLGDDVRLIAGVVKQLRAFNRSEQMIQLAGRPAVSSSSDVQVLSDMAAMMSSINAQDLALQLLDRALRLAPDFPPALANRGHVLMYFGRSADAVRDLNRCIERAPEMARAHWVLSRVATQSESSNHISRLRRQLEKATSDGDRAFLGYALFKELDDLDQRDAAWSALQDAWHAKRRQLNYHPAETTALVDDLTSTVTDVDSFAAVASDGPQPVFIVGLHRSGTTLLERILGGHREVTDAGELYDFTAQLRAAANHRCQGALDRRIIAASPGFNYPEIGRGYLNSAAWRAAGRRYFTDKLPTNALNIGFILRALPNARILNMVRDPMAVGYSNLKELFSNACGYSYDMRETAHYIAEHQRLMAHWHRIAPGRILDVHYAQLVAEPEQTARKVMDYCGLPFDPATLTIEKRDAAVATASSQQVRQGIHRKSLTGWRRFEQQLEPLRTALVAASVNLEQAGT